ncbi:MAG: hypothetical protein LKJ44_07940 [Bifidobacteriaceae bacterium]|jgi:hypothetical protein|nr:hypothetical protein [Bifidobacteriaceae bacterium]
MSRLSKATKKIACAVAAFLLCSVSAGCGEQAEVPTNVASAAASILNLPPELTQALVLFTVQCAQDKGYEIRTSLEVHSSSATYFDVGGIFSSQQQALSTGYPESTVDYDKGADAIDEFERSLGADEDEKFKNEVVGNLDLAVGQDTSCATVATTWLYGSEKNYSALVDAFNDYSSQKTSSALQDSGVSEAISEKYVPCMVAAGYEVKGLTAGTLAAEKIGVYRKWNEPPGDAEKALALQDYLCQEKSHIGSLVKEAQEKIANEWMLANEALLLERQELLRAAMGRAQKIISGSFTYGDYLQAHQTGE